jgi:hypothetical protein
VAPTPQSKRNKPVDAGFGGHIISRDKLEINVIQIGDESPQSPGKKRGSMLSPSGKPPSSPARGNRKKINYT